MSINIVFIEITYAQEGGTVPLSGQYDFGWITSLGDFISKQLLGATGGPLFAIFATITVFFIIFGGFKYLTSGGDKEALASARNTLTYAIIGFILLIFMFLVVRYLPQALNLGDQYKIIP